MNFWKQLIKPSASIVEIDRRRQSQVLASIIVAVIVLGIPTVVMPIILTRLSFAIEDPVNVVSFSAMFLLVIAYILNRRGRYQIAALLTVGILIVAIFAAANTDPVEAPILLIYMVIPTLTSSILLSLRTSLILTVLMTLGMFVMFFALPPSGKETVPILYNMLIASLILLSLRHRDLVERDRQAELAESEARFRAIFMEAPIGVAMIDENLRFVRVNHRLSEMLDYTEQDMQQLKFSQIVHPEDANDSLRLVKIEQRYQVEQRCITQKGHTLWINLTASKIYEKNVPYGLLMIEDITERKEMEQAERKAEMLRVQLEKEREVSEFKARFMSAVSHEFRTPLTTILSSNELLERYSERMEPQSKKENHARIQTSVKRLTQMMDDLLNVSRNDSGTVSFNPHRVDLAAFCRELIDEIKTTNDPKNNLIFRQSGQVEPFPADINLMRYILTNLLLNAIKYTPSGDDITCELLAENDEVVLTIADKGIGIPQEDQTHLFEPFFRGSNVGTIKGTGLGLKIVKDYIELHGGTISCESQPGEGTTFTVRLPLEAHTN